MSEQKHEDHGKENVDIQINGVTKSIHRGHQTVVEIKTLGGVPLADDLDQKELMMTIEERFGIHLKQAELSRIRRISDIILVVQKYWSEKKTMESRKYQNGIQSSSRGTCKNGK